MASIAASVRRCFAGRVRRTPDQVVDPPSPNTAPTAPSVLVVTSQTQTSITFRWSPSESTDGLDIAGYKVFQDDDLIALQSSNVAIATGLTAGNSYTFYVIGYTEVLDSEASTDLVASTLASDLIPDPFPFTPKPGVSTSTPTESDPVTISGINGQAYTYVSNGEWSKNGGAYTATNGYVENGDTVRLRHTSAPSIDTSVNTTLYITGVGSIFTSTTAPADSIPDDFGFVSRSGVDFNMPISSTAVPITGINVPVAISVVGGTYSINGGVATSAPGMISNGQTVTLTHTSDTQPLTPKTTVVTVAGIDRSFTSTTKADTQAPSVPFQNAPVNVGPDGFTISWQPSTDDVEVGGYIVYANGQYKGYTTGDTTFPLSGYPASTSVTFTVRAFDPSGNVSAPSNSRVGTTPPEPAVNNRTLAGALQVTAVRAAGSIAVVVPSGTMSISGAVVGGSTMTITGNGFGTKPATGPGGTVAPWFFRTWIGSPTGGDWVSAGYTRRHDNFYGAESLQSSGGINNAPAMRIMGNLNGPNSYGLFTQPQIDLPAGVTTLFHSHWFRIKRAAGISTSHQVQFKGPRFGPKVSNTAVDNYRATPSIGHRFETDLTWASRENTNLILEYANAGELSSYSQNITPTPTGIANNTVLNMEGWVRWNDVGQANGAYEVHVNGQRTNFKANLANRTSGSQFFGYFSPHPGLDGYGAQSAGDWEIYVSRPYVDTTLARVFLGNAATIGGCTGRFMLPPTTWSDTSITVSDCAGIPSGYDWVYVVKSDGTTSNGVAYT